jgi:hypothetical protein
MLEPVMIFSPATVVPGTVRVDGDTIMFDTSVAMTQFVETGNIVTLRDFQTFGAGDFEAQIIDIAVSGSGATITLKRIDSCQNIGL